MDGFETCRRIQAEPAWAHIPVIFMTGLSDTEHVVAGFAAGGVDYVVKPVRAQEVLARLATHVRNARAARLARQAVDVGGLGVMVVDARGRLAWQSPRAQAWVTEAFGEEAACLRWLQDGAGQAEVLERHLPDGRMLAARALGGVGVGETMWLLRLRAATTPAPARGWPPRS